MRYHAYEFAHAMTTPMRFAAKNLQLQTEFPVNPFYSTPMGKSIAAGCAVFERLTRRYSKPRWGIDAININGYPVRVEIEPAYSKPFCELLHFKKVSSLRTGQQDPKVLMIAPMSGHYATLLRGTVQAMLREHDVYVTDWINARDMPIFQGRFDLDDFIDYIMDFVRLLGPRTHVIAVCQPAVPALAATAILAVRNAASQPASLTLMGGPIDTRRNPTVVNELASKRPMSWFQQNVVTTVPWPHAGFMRRVCPGFIQLSGFMTMNLERHR